MKDYILMIILIIVTIISVLMTLVIKYGFTMWAISYSDKAYKSDYIQNLETKLNIYEESYDNFVAEDNARQGETNV